MTEYEIMRRLRVLAAMHPDERPISINRLEQLVGVEHSVYGVLKGKGTMRTQMRKRLSRALTLVENDQVVIKRHHKGHAEITVRPPQPPVRIVPVVEFTGAPPRLRFLAQNPNALPDPLVKNDDRPAHYRGFLQGRKRRIRVSGS